MRRDTRWSPIMSPILHLVKERMKWTEPEQLPTECSAKKYYKTNKLRGLSPQENNTDRSSDRRLSAKLVSTFADRGCRVVSATDPHNRILGFLDRSRYYFFQVAPQLYSRGWMDPVRDPLLLRKPGSAGNRTRTSGSVARNSDHQTTEAV
jgi:hypothetical protein